MRLLTKRVYIIVSASDTLPAKLIRHITRAEYNHSSISFDDDLQTFYSFGRKHMWTPLIGGFIEETPNTGVFALYPNSRACVLSIETDEEKYNAAKGYVEEMYKNRRKHKYNYIGVCLAVLHKSFKRKRHFYCSEFVSDVLLRFGIIKEGSLGKIVKPTDFFFLENSRIIYRGLMSNLTSEPKRGLLPEYNRKRAEI